MSNTEARKYCACLGCARKVVLRHRTQQPLQLSDILKCERTINRHRLYYGTSQAQDRKCLDGSADESEVLRMFLDMDAKGELFGSDDNIGVRVPGSPVQSPAEDVRVPASSVQSPTEAVAHSPPPQHLSYRAAVYPIPQAHPRPTPRDSPRPRGTNAESSSADGKGGGGDSNRPEKSEWDFMDVHKAWASEAGFDLDSGAARMIKAVMAVWPEGSKPDLSTKEAFDASCKSFEMLSDIGMCAGDLTTHAASTHRNFHELEATLKEKLKLMHFIRLREGLQAMAGVQQPMEPAKVKRKSTCSVGLTVQQKRSRVGMNVMDRIKEAFAEELGRPILTKEERKSLENLPSRMERFKRIVQELGGVDKAAKSCFCPASMQDCLSALDKIWKTRLKNVQQSTKKGFTGSSI